jgi:hypothetical protein
MVSHVNQLHAGLVFPFLVSVDYAVGYRNRTLIKTCDICHGQYTKAVAQDQGLKHTCNKNRATMVQHAANASTSMTMDVVALAFLNA